MSDVSLHRHSASHSKKNQILLNAAQQQAVDTIEGPVMVLAGPGTGKTQVLAARIASILEKTDTAARSILAITFTDAAAKTMRERLVSMIGHQGYYVGVMTYHALCSEIISEYTDFFPMHPGSEPLSDRGRYEIVERLIGELDLDLLKPPNDPLYYARTILESISNLKKEGFSAERYQQLVTESFAEEPDTTSKTILSAFERDKQKNSELSRIYSRYQQELQQAARYDFDDMILLVLKAFESHPELLQTYQEQYQYVLVDEYQDTNAVQNELLWKLCEHWGASANVFVVGDPHQAIYRFQGASVENTYAFLARFPHAAIITLEDAYRCPQPIYDAAHALIQHNELTAQTDLPVEQVVSRQLQTKLKATPRKSDGLAEVATSTLTAPIRVYSAASDLVEWLSMAEQIARLTASGVGPQEIAVLSKTNAQSRQIATVLRGKGIPVQITADLDALETDVVQSLLALITVVRDLRDTRESGELFSVLLQPWWKHNPDVVYQLTQAAGKKRQQLYSFLKSSSAQTVRKATFDATQEEIASVQDTLKALETFGLAEKKSNLRVWLQEVLQESGMLDWHAATMERYPDLIALASFIQTVDQWCVEEERFDLNSLLDEIAIHQSHGLTIPVVQTGLASEAVELSTVHAAKGKEWQYVFIPNCIDGFWGNTRSKQLIKLPDDVLKYTDISKKERNEDDRRLFYVALTRARLQVTCSYPQFLTSKGKQKEQVKSMFLHESGLTVFETPLRLDAEDEAGDLLRSLLAPPSTLHITPRVKKYLAHLVADLRLSASMLQRYLRDPQEFILTDLLKVPSAIESHLVYGTAVHAGLEQLTHQHLGGQIDLEAVFAVLDMKLRQGLLPEQDRARRLDMGKVIVQSYLNAGHMKPDTVLHTERVFGTLRQPVHFEDIALTGRIDRIDWLDKEAGSVQVIDYKTSTAKSDNHIAGVVGLDAMSERERSLPESIRGALKRQLLFYKLLTDLDPGFKYRAEVGQFEFLNAKSVRPVTVRRVSFIAQEIEELKQLIAEVMSEIRTLSFL